MDVVLPFFVDETNLIEFDTFHMHDVDAVTRSIPFSDLEASAKCLEVALATQEWKPYQYNEGTKIGYGTSDNLDGFGLTEEESYKSWITEFKSKERIFKRNFILNTLTQTQYDALLLLYYRTGDFKNIGSSKRKLNIITWIKEGKWDYIATAMINSGYQRPLRQREAGIMMLADYGQPFTRSDLRRQGLQELRRVHPDLLEGKQKLQAEYVYYKETGRFLPRLTQSRMRQITKQSESR